MFVCWVWGLHFVVDCFRFRLWVWLYVLGFVCARLAFEVWLGLVCAVVMLFCAVFVLGVVWFRFL